MNEFTILERMETARIVFSEPTALMRFVRRDGSRILQQRWVVEVKNELGRRVSRHEEWRDVPLMENEE